jgi:multisubunit Na+/H+ antiporter MnhB subunit
MAILATGDHNSVNITGGAASNAGAQPVYKVRFALKVVAFIAAVISLSWFFQGWREVNQTPGIASFALLVFGTSLTLLIVGVMAYWTYFEEKSKGTLKKRIGFYEDIHTRLQARKQGEKEHHE